MEINNTTSTPGPLLEFLGRVAYEFEVMGPLFPTYLHLLVSAIFPIYTAAHASLSRPPSAAPRKRRRRTERDYDDDDDAEQEESQTIEALTPSDAILFPILAGATLATLYFILKWLEDPAWLNWVLGIYFSQIGLFFAMKFLKDVFSVARSFLLPGQYTTRGVLWEVDERHHCFKNAKGDIRSSPLPGFLRALPIPASLSKRAWRIRGLLYAKAKLDFHLDGIVTVKTSVDVLDLASLVLSCGIGYFHGFISKPWFLTNFLGFSFCYGSLQYMTPTTAWTGTLVLAALFFYDIYFVFFTPMMVTVATKLDVPIKLLFPRPDGCIFPVGAPEGSSAMEEYLQCLAKKRTMAMLGLGDIVVPGMMLAFALRFDLYLFYLKQGQSPPKETKSENENEPKKPPYYNAKGSWGERFWTSSSLWSPDIKAKKFPKPYFYATVVGYLAGMITTVIVMQVAEHAQPALLYLVPGVLLSLWGTALLRGDMKALWLYNELPEGDKKEGKPTEAVTQARKDASSGTVENGGIEQNHGDAPHDKKPAESGSEKQKAAKEHHRRLVYFSITLPEPTREESASGEKDLSTSTTDSADADTEPANMVVQDHDLTNKGVLNGTVQPIPALADTSTGERPEKRRRKG